MLDRSQLQQLVNAGLSDQEVADKLGVSSRTILRWRKRYRIRSQWTPPVPEHGTAGRYGRGCSCTECLNYNSVYQLAYERRRNLESIPTAHRQYEPWTAAEDATVLAHTPAEAAPLLGRSWHACRVRRDRLSRAQEVATV